MKLEEYRKHLESIPFGKRLPGALYVFRDPSSPSSLGTALDELLQRVAESCGANESHNILKFRLDELKISFLAYPTFLEDAHPALHHAITVDLVTGKTRLTDYGGNPNPPILHRKETFLPPDHPRRAEFETLTKLEEKAGLFEETATSAFEHGRSVPANSLPGPASSVATSKLIHTPNAQSG